MENHRLAYPVRTRLKELCRASGASVLVAGRLRHLRQKPPFTTAPTMTRSFC